MRRTVRATCTTLLIALTAPAASAALDPIPGANPVNGSSYFFGNNSTSMELLLAGGAIANDTVNNTPLPPTKGGNFWTVTLSKLDIQIGAGGKVQIDLTLTHSSAPHPAPDGGAGGASHAISLTQNAAGVTVFPISMKTDEKDLAHGSHNDLYGSAVLVTGVVAGQVISWKLTINARHQDPAEDPKFTARLRELLRKINPLKGFKRLIDLGTVATTSGHLDSLVFGGVTAFTYNGTLGSAQSAVTGAVAQPGLGTLTGLGDAPPGGGVLPLHGFVRLCLLSPGCGSDSIPIPLTSTTGNGSIVGVGAGGTVLRSDLGLTLFGSPWTSGTAMVTNETVNGSIETLSAYGFRHGPASLSSSTQENGGVVQLVTPIQVYTQGYGRDTIGGFGVLQLEMVPEPSRLLLFGGGALALWLLGLSKRR